MKKSISVTSTRLEESRVGNLTIAFGFARTNLEEEEMRELNQMPWYLSVCLRRTSILTPCGARSVISDKAVSVLNGLKLCREGRSGVIFVRLMARLFEFERKWLRWHRRYGTYGTRG